MGLAKKTLYATNTNDESQRIFLSAYIPEKRDNEYWIKCKVKMKCIGYVYILYRDRFFDKPHVKFKYLKKFG